MLWNLCGNEATIQAKKKNLSQLEVSSFSSYVAVICTRMLYLLSCAAQTQQIYFSPHKGGNSKKLWWFDRQNNRTLSKSLQQWHVSQTGIRKHSSDISLLIYILWTHTCWCIHTKWDTSHPSRSFPAHCSCHTQRYQRCYFISVRRVAAVSTCRRRRWVWVLVR